MGVKTARISLCTDILLFVVVVVARFSSMSREGIIRLRMWLNYIECLAHPRSGNNPQQDACCAELEESKASSKSTINICTFKSTLTSG